MNEQTQFKIDTSGYVHKRPMTDSTMDRVSRLIGIYAAMPSGGLEGYSSRDHDNQWEAGDGDAVLSKLQEIARSSESFARSLLAYPACRYVPPALLDVARENR